MILALLVLCIASLSSCFGGNGEWLDQYREEKGIETENKYLSVTEPPETESTSDNDEDSLPELEFGSDNVFVGISIAEFTDMNETRDKFGSYYLGVYITAVETGYNDDVLRYGDRIISIDGTDIYSPEDVLAILGRSRVGDVLTFTVARDGAYTNVYVGCYEKPVTE